MKVVYFGTYRTEYSRNRIMIAGLRGAGVEVIECHEPLWGESEDRVRAVSGEWLSLTFFYRVLRAYIRLAWRGIKLPQYDVLICGYPGHFDVFLARALSFFRQRPLVWDVFMSLYLITIERGLGEKSQLTTSLLYQIEKRALRLPNLLIQDTPAYVTWFAKTHGAKAEKFRLVPTGADNRIFHPTTGECKDINWYFKILYYGSFIPNHGVPYIIEAARLLEKEKGLLFEMIGEGPDQAHCFELVKQYNLKNISFLPWMPQDELVIKIASADLCLGAFGKTPQSLMTIQNKIYEGLAMARPVVTGDSPTVRVVLQHGVNVWLCDRERPESLAEAIRILKDDPILRQEIAKNGLTLFTKFFGINKLGEQFYLYLSELL